MKYTIKWCEVKKTGEKNGRPWKLTKMTLVDEEGKETDNVTTFNEVNNGGTIEGEILKEGEYLNFKTKLEKPEFMKGNYKSQEIKKTAFEIQKNVSENVAQAQDRSSWMWAKTNASTLIANSNFVKTANLEQLHEMVAELATNIYNQEPLRPFN